jgi:tetratricopeptide (TPR) repeat protein
MRAFLSHSSLNKAVVISVRNALEKDATWLDSAEIEWGDLFLEKISEGIQSATDFVLFWSAPAAKSEWVRLEINMAFIQALNQKAIRLRVVTLDNTPLPLYLKPFEAFSVAGLSDPAKEILEKLTPLLWQPIRSGRARFVNRNDEIARIEDAVDDPDIFAIWLVGFTGVGKSSLANEALRRVFEGASSLSVGVTEGTGFVELALSLNALARKETLPESLPQDEIERQIRLSLETVAKDGRLLVLSNVQHWLDEAGEPRGPLPVLLKIVRELPAFARRPVFFTSTRRPHLEPQTIARLNLMSIKGLADDHIAVLVRNWYYSIFGREIPPEDAARIAPKLFGHPIAARLVAGLLGDHSVEYLEKYPKELISLRRDLARFLLQDLKLGPPAEKLMETLALVGIGLPAPIIAAAGFTDEEFQQAVEQCTRAGLITADTKIEGHPLFQEFFWHRLHRTTYQEQAKQLANILRGRLTSIEKTSPEFAELLPVTFRLFALADDLSAAIALRKDLSGEIESAAIILYNRRNYSLADKYISHVLDSDPRNWRMRVFRARIRVREQDWAAADKIVSELLKERPSDVGALHLKGWRLQKEVRLQEALDVFAGIVSRREHIQSLASAAECLHRLNRNDEALKFLSRAKAVESENPFVLDLESRILEDMGELEPAYKSAALASARDPLNAFMHHRLGQIRSKQRRADLAIPHFRRAIELNADLFGPANSLASAYLETDNCPAAEGLLQDLTAKGRTPGDRALLEHTKARIAFFKKDLEGSEQTLKSEIANSRNLVPNLGLLVHVELALFDRNVGQYPAIADVALHSAEQALSRIQSLDPTNPFIENLRPAIVERRGRRKR